MDKQALRRDVQQILRGIPSEAKTLLSRQIRGHLERLIDGGPFGTVAAYAALRNEPNLDALFWELPIRWALPRMASEKIELRQVETPEDLAPGAFKIREPNPKTCPIVTASDPGLILIPGLAFSPGGGRLGRGKGHYDRFLSDLIGKKAPPLRLGICFEAQLRDEIPLEPHDIPMDGIVTEKGVFFRDDNGHPVAKES